MNHSVWLHQLRDRRLSRQEKWDKRFLMLARHIGGWSKDESTKVGAVIVDDLLRCVSFGYNGFPRGIDDSPEVYADRERKLSCVVHAEMNAILNSPRSTRGTTLYTSALPPCDRCAAHIIQAGIVRVVSEVPKDGVPDRWSKIMEDGEAMLRQAGIPVVKVVL